MWMWGNDLDNSGSTHYVFKEDEISWLTKLNLLTMRYGWKLHKKIVSKSLVFILSDY